MKKESYARHCHACRRIIFWVIPDGNPLLGLVQMCKTKTLLEFRHIKEKPDGSGNYYCMDCLKKMFPGKY